MTKKERQQVQVLRDELAAAVLPLAVSATINWSFVEELIRVVGQVVLTLDRILLERKP